MPDSLSPVLRSFVPGRGSRMNGFTLVEVIVALAILILVTLATVYMSMGTVRMSQVDSMRIAATNTIARELEVATAIAKENADVGGTALGLLSHLKNLLDNSDPSTTYNSSTGVISHQFPVMPSGFSMEGNDRLMFGIGVMDVYLTEDGVPDAFWAWQDIDALGGASSSSHLFFDMDDNFAGGGDFRSLLTTPDRLWGGSGLKKLPLTVNVDYYIRPVGISAPEDIYDPAVQARSGGVAVSTSRIYIINDSLLKPTTAGAVEPFE